MSTNSFTSRLLPQEAQTGHPRFRLHPHGSRRGVALIITLAFVVLLTFAVVAYFSRATADRSTENISAGRVKADLLARSSMEKIINDLKLEMLVNSATNTQLGVTILSPKSAAYMVPQKSVKAAISGSATFSTLVKQSIGGSVNCSTASLDGRNVSSQRWNKPLLTTGTFTAAGQTPNWSIVTRSGIVSGTAIVSVYGDAVLSNTNYAIGRVAYNIYDEGGLLDVNVAGYPKPASAPLPGPIRSTLADRELGQISAGAGTFATWRNALNSGTAAYTSHILQFAAPNGFLKLYVDPSTNKSNNRLLSRQDLIKLAQNGTLGISSTSLPYLTTFTRELNAPSWTPQLDAGNGYNYKSNAELPTMNAGIPPVPMINPNRDIPNIRVSGTFSRSDGTTARAGEPLINRRFPLSRIAGLRYDGVNSTGLTTMTSGTMVVASAATVSRDFGLQWNGAYNRWIYTAYDPKIFSNSQRLVIEDLATVAGEGREPNFFELLKAGVLSGSLGKYTGAPSKLDNSVQLPWHSALENNLAMDQNTDRQILQIGANIIDQYDADDVPTRIATNVTTNFNGKPDLNIVKLDVFGVENNPYIQYVFQTHFRDLNTFVASGTTTLTKYPNVVSYNQFQMWNPHGNATTAGSPAASQFKITATQGQTYTGAVVANQSNLKGTVENLADRSIAFTHAPTPDPYLLNSTFASSSVPSGRYVNGSSKLIGFYLGSLPLKSNLFNGTSYWVYVGYVSPVIYELSGNFGAAGWRVIEQFGELLDDSMYASEWGSTSGDMFYFAAQSLTSGNPNWVSGLVWGNSDPRVLRGGFGGSSNGSNMVNTFKPDAGGFWQFNYTSSSSPCWSTTGGTYVFSETWLNLSSSKTQHRDLDGVLRRGDLSAANIDPSTSGPSITTRPIMLNRPFESVTEIGYAMRGDPWRTLNMFSVDSPDAALLDMFSAIEQPGMVAGRVNFNTQQPKVLEVLLKTVAQKTKSGTPLTLTEVTAFASALPTLTRTTTPLVNKADLVTKYATSGAYASAFTAANTTDLIKERRESPIRALADVGQTRTWNLMIDVIAQAGRYPSNASGLDKFVVEGETRYWLHVAIDRFTGQVIDTQLEAVNE